MTQTVIQLSGRSGLAAGTRLNDIYELESTIAAGGMGEVYKGRLIETGDPVAIKMIKPELAGNEAVLSLFRKEASALHYLHHDSIVRYFVFSVDRKLNRPYLAMEYVGGPSLSDYLKTRPLTFDEVAILRKRIASGLQVAHDKGVIHRDLSPDNIILQDGEIRNAKIIDFGIARTTKLGHATVIGDGFAGKYNYVSPEQLGLFGGDVTNRSDIYSFGLVLVEALLGKPIDMSGSQADVIQKRQKVPDITGVDARLRPLIEKMLQPKPEDRPASMDEVAAWTAPEKKKSGLGLIGAAAAALLVAAGGAGYMLLGRSPAPGPVPTPQPPTTPSVVATHDPTPTPNTPSLQPSQTDPTPPSNNTQIASIPPQPALPPVDPPVEPLAVAPMSPTERANRVSQYVRYFDGGPCLYLAPTAVTERTASVDAFTLSDQLVQNFDTDFRLANGFAPQISTARLSATQCPAVAFMQRVDPDRDPAVKFDVRQSTVKPGQRVQGVIEGVGDRAVDIITVGDTGKVKTLGSAVKKEKGSATFDVRLDDDDNSLPGSKLVIAVVSPKPIDSMATASKASAWDFFPPVLEEIDRNKTPTQLIAKLVRIER
ncbi:serine/threonine-protein kinase [Terrarubrum flagellatum]|uniref:serine/threonine-protein kinase n=1 Tax=Terrirubrum flagellatum TaxID=2895980 RepID=UPI003144EF04